MRSLGGCCLGVGSYCPCCRVAVLIVVRFFLGIARDGWLAEALLRRWDMAEALFRCWDCFACPGDGGGGSQLRRFRTHVRTRYQDCCRLRRWWWTVCCISRVGVRRLWMRTRIGCRGCSGRRRGRHRRMNLGVLLPLRRRRPWRVCLSSCWLIWGVVLLLHFLRLSTRVLVLSCRRWTGPCWWWISRGPGEMVVGSRRILLRGRRWAVACWPAALWMTPLWQGSR